MMKRIGCWRNRVFLGIFITLAASGLGHAGEFSADLVQSTAQGEMKGKIFVKGEHFRQETAMMGQTQIVIFRKDKKVVWMLMPQSRMYMEMPASAQGENIPQMDQDALERLAKKTSLGKEKVSGYLCEKTRYVFQDPSHGTMIQWFSKKLGFPVKMEMDGPRGRFTTEYRNIKETKLAQSLFEVPDGFQKMSMPQMMRGMQGGGR